MSAITLSQQIVHLRGQPKKILKRTAIWEAGEYLLVRMKKVACEERCCSRSASGRSWLPVGGVAGGLQTVSGVNVEELNAGVDVNADTISNLRHRAPQQFRVSSSQIQEVLAQCQLK